VYQPIYDNLGDDQWSAMFLGLLVKECVLERVARGESWGTYLNEIPGHDYLARCYWPLDAEQIAAIRRAG
jgi:hypothetical protein